MTEIEYVAAKLAQEYYDSIPVKIKGSAEDTIYFQAFMRGVEEAADEMVAVIKKYELPTDLIDDLKAICKRSEKAPQNMCAHEHIQMLGEDRASGSWVLMCEGCRALSMNDNSVHEAYVKQLTNGRQGQAKDGKTPLIIIP